MIMTILKISLLLILGYLLKWMYDRRIQEEEKEFEMSKETYEFGFLTKDLLSEFENLDMEIGKEISPELKIGNIRVNIIRRDSKIIAAALYSWPSGLWELRRNNNDNNLTKYSHIYYIEVVPDFRRQGYFSKMMENIIFETHRMSEGITLYTKTEEQTKIFESEFGFRVYKDNLMVLKFSDDFSVVY